MAWPQKVKDKVLVACGRHCCICHKFCGTKIELHHIKLKSEGGTETEDNCIPLCFDCHADQKSYDFKHPKGTKYSPRELNDHRDKWYNLAQQSLGTGTSDHLEQDKETFKIIYDLVPADKTIYFLKTKDFNSRKFSLTPIKPISELLLKVHNEAWIEFYDSDLEALRLRLFTAFEEFTDKIRTDTYNFPDTQYDTQCVPREWMEQQPARYHETVDFLNKKADEIAIIYTNLVRLSRKKLGVKTA
ncbi:HNH endonuclease [Dokdonia sp. PRO95]|uniref:HNH endonuclease n=1 Tax=Dokdonia sp. PRO95 TaxID=1239415 RepID=UPI00054E73A6|nr:HNH endonuclease [Dokdonia sp. PRO95]